MNIYYNISIYDFWTLAREREWLYQADAYQGQGINQLILDHQSDHIENLTEFIKSLSASISIYSKGHDKEDIASALLTIIRMNASIEK